MRWFSSRTQPDSPLAFVSHYILLGRRRFVPLFGLVFFAGCCAVAVQYEMKVLVDSMAAPSRALERVAWPFALFVAIVGIESVLWRAAGWLGAYAVVDTGVRIRLDLFDQLSRRPLAFFTGSFSGALGGRITAVSGAFGALTNTFIWNIMPPCIDFAGALVLFAMLDAGMSAAVCICVVSIGAGLLFFGLRGRPHHQLYAGRAGWAAGELVDTISNISLVKMFGARSREHDRLQRILQDEASAQRRSWTYLEKSRMLHDVLLWVAAAGVLGWAMSRWVAGQFSPGDVVLVSALTFRILHGSRDLALAVIGTSNHLAVIRETLQLLQAPQAPDAVLSRPPIRHAPPRIEISNVSFGYAQDRQVLDRLTLDIPPGQRIGIIGPSGAGKSTLLALIHALHPPQSGEIRLDGERIQTLSDDCVRQTIAFVPQDVSLFHRTILENLRYGAPDASEAEVAAAAEAAQCQFIDGLPDGYHTIVGERGAMLSGGQRQRLAIARALLRRSPVLLLDEASSALDDETELRLRSAMLRFCTGRTLIAATHRLATLKSFDRVIVLKDGAVVQDGSPAAVIAGAGAGIDHWLRDGKNASGRDVTPLQAAG